MERINLDILQENVKKSATRAKKIHSEIHDLADEVSLYFGEKKKFGLWLGVIKRVGVARGREFFSQVKQSHALTIQDQAKLFMWLSSKKNKKSFLVNKNPPSKTRGMKGS